MELGHMAGSKISEQEKRAEMDSNQKEYVPCTQQNDFRMMVPNSQTFPDTSPFILSTQQFASRTPLPQYMFPSQPVPTNQNHFQTSAMSSTFYATPVSNLHASNLASTFIPPSATSPTLAAPCATVPEGATEDGTKNKRRKGQQQTKATSKKATKKVASKEVVNVDDGSEEEEESSRKKWPDKHVVALIHARGELNSEFVRPPKQGVNLWDKVRVKIVGLCPDFNRDSGACRKKWSNVFKQYQQDVSWNQVSGNDRKESCGRYELMDSYFSEKANVKKHVHAGAIDEDCTDTIRNGAQLHGELEKDVDSKSEIGEVKNESGDSSITKGKKTKNIAAGLLEQVLNAGKEMNKTLEEHRQNETRKIDIMERIEKSFTKLVDRFTT